MFCFAVQGAAQTPWVAVGPDGGDARSFAAVPGNPHRIYMGAVDSWIYESENRGASWHRLAKLDDTEDLVVDHIFVSPTNPLHMVVAAWSLNHKGGGLWLSDDGGRSWKKADGLKGQSIRAFQAAPSDPTLLVAGTLDGIFRSMDGAMTWTQISPPNSKEIHEVESVAIHPADPQVIYAGTWHLPWKTIDGGRSWQSIKQGLIEDSDVFSIIVDPSQPNIVYTSACTGIYKSENGGEVYRKLQGIPLSAQRTRVLKQDPTDSQVVYAGTTEGLYKTSDGGKTFKRTTGSDIIVNDIYIDPSDSQHVLLATDGSGVLLSDNGGITFVYANSGFSGRKVAALLVDTQDPKQLYAGVVSARIYSGVYASSDGGSHWEHIARGLDGRDVFALAQSQQGALLAGTNHGIFILSNKEWKKLQTIPNLRKSGTRRLKKHLSLETSGEKAAKPHEGRVYALDLTGDAWLAPTSAGLLMSRDQGDTWEEVPVRDSTEYVTVAAQGAIFIAAKRNGLIVSTDAGRTWSVSQMPSPLTRIDRVVFSSDGAAWLGGREGVFISKDQGASWQWIDGLPLKDANDLYFDSYANKVLVSSRGSDFVYAIDPENLRWTRTWVGSKVHLIRSARGKLLAASPNEGVLIPAR